MRVYTRSLQKYSNRNSDGKIGGNKNAFLAGRLLNTNPNPNPKP